MSEYTFENEVQVVDTDIFKREFINEAGESVLITVEGVELKELTKQKLNAQVKLFTQMIRDILAETGGDLL